MVFNEVSNVERFEEFLANLENNNPDRIRVTGYTDEGDPIFKDLEYDGKVIQYSYDNSHDAYGGSQKGKKIDVCSRITTEDVLQGQIDYVISDCVKNYSDVSYFLLRIEKPSLDAEDT
ncbi:DUF4362 domain-containing protein [Paenibacillus montanisoli]|uniref:DUF4362 domain-containing protein n=1 Tax=Paenibacillus montanisoli TaxID=2081970 RepID=UPI00140268FF|nr:DUF4362 domain-containing protein [Paenibacillus montanisoli]